MAGLVGIFRPGGLTAVDHAFVKRGAARLDYTGTSQFDGWADGFLSLCRVHHPHQVPPAPATSPGGGLRLVADGEIFDIDDAARPFQPASGVDHCLELYAREGVGALTRLNGHFTILVYEAGARTLQLASDRFAARPLHYRRSGDALSFATQARALLAGDLTPRPNLGAIAQYFAFEAVLDDSTLVEGVRTLPPASVLTHPGDAPPRRYWTLSYVPDAGGSARPYADGLAEALRGAIHRQTRGTAGLGLLLSGGMDSRVIVPLAASPLAAITLADHENSEVALARRVAATRSLPFCFVRRDPDFYGGLVDLATDLGDGAYRFDHAHFAGLIRDLPPTITTVVSGYGFDSIIKGLILPKRLRHLFGWAVNRHDLMPFPTRVSASGLVDLALAWGPLAGGADSPLLRLFALGIRRRAEESLRAAMTGILERTADAAPSTVQWYESLRMNMMAMGLPHFLNVLSVRHFFRDRTPAFDNAVLEAYRTAPPRLRLDGRLYLGALRQLAPEMLAIPDANTGLRPDMHYLVQHLHHRARLVGERLRLRRPPAPPDPIFTERSWPNMGEMIRRRASVGGRLAESLKDPAALPPDLFDVGAIGEMLDAHQARRADFTYLLLLVLTFAVWHRRTVSGSAAEAA
jgi:hypothetical protein